MKRILCIVLAAIMLLSFAACTTEEPEKTTPAEVTSDKTPDDTTNEVVSTKDPALELVLPDETYNDYVFRIGNTGYKDTKYTFSRMTSEAPSGDIIDNAIYRRTTQVEDRLGVSILESDLSYSELETALASNEYTYDIGTATLSNIMKAVNKNYCVDFNTVETVHLDKPWWDQNAKEKLGFCEKLFYTFSDAVIYGLDNTRAMYFNKDMYKTLFPDGQPIYDLLADGNWTITQMFKMAEKAVEENGDGVLNENDTFGVANNNTTFFEVMLTGCEAEIVQINDDGDPYFFCHGETQAKFVEVFDKLVGFFGTSGVYYRTDATTSRNMFIGGKSLFITDTMQAASVMRREQLNFGILPVPKYNPKQANYLNVSPNGHAFFICNSANADNARTGAVLEALSYYSSQYNDSESLIPQYFELALKSKSSTDDESMESLQIIHDNISYVIKITGTTFSNAIYGKFANNDRNISSFLSANETVNTKMLSDVLDAYR